jgi:tetratricopeptide (TPR) repeat protein
MKMIKQICLLILLSCISFSCDSSEEREPILKSADYNVYLDISNDSYLSAKKDNQFWSKRMAQDSSGVGDLGPLAGTYTAMFMSSGDVTYLKNAEALYKKAISISATNHDGYTRSLAQNYISQHRFKEAQEMLEVIYAGPTNKRVTELQLFDTYMETGNFDKAFENLEKVKNTRDYQYLIRLAKWSDHRGNLDAAIKYLEKAKVIAESGGLKPLKIWTYSNLGDFYGHAGRIKEAYEMYLNTLAMQPDNAYAKKGIAWIAYSYAHDTAEAKRILNKIMESHKAPDYYLLKAEIAEYEGNKTEMEENLVLFEEAASDPNYGEMFNAYFIEYYSETAPKKALSIAQQEVLNRATPETYHLLALAQLKNGMNKEALQTIETYVMGKTEEPMALLHAAYVFKTNGQEDKVKQIKKELENASFEIGPILTQKVKSL